MLLGIFIKSPEQRILSLFAMNPDRSFYGREISKKLGISLGSVHAALSSLEKSRLLVFQHVGKTKLYRLEPARPVINALRVFNTVLLLEPLIEAVKDISRRVVLYGSYSTGTFTVSSDLDLLIVSGDKEKILAKIGSFKRKTGFDIRPIIKDQVEWMRLEENSPEFHDELGRGITLWEKPVDGSGF